MSVRNKRNSFILYTDYSDHIDCLTLEEKGLLFEALFEYAKGIEVELSGAVKVAFCFIKAQIDRDSERYEEVCEKRRNAGKKGGAPKGNKNAEKTTKNNQKQPKTTKNNQKQTKQPDTDTDTDNDNDTDTDNENDKDLKNKKDLSKNSTRKKFIIPSIEEVRAYCQERNNRVDPEAFVAYYTAKDWMIGKNKMKDWKAAVITWERRAKQADKSLEFNRCMVVDDEFFRKKIGGEDDKTRNLEAYSGYA
jgi:hypothetical protein